MTRAIPRTVLAACSAFLVFSTIVELCLAAVYARGVTRLTAAGTIGERGVRVLARPIRLEVGETFSSSRLADHLHRIGYYPARVREAGCYRAEGDAMTIWARYPELPDVTIRWNGDVIAAVTAAGASSREATIEPETVLTLDVNGANGASRTSHIPVAHAALVDTPLLDAIIASEDRWFSSHHGLDLLRLGLVPIVGGGASTITMQVARLDVLRDRSRTLTRKLNEIGVAMAIERVYAKDAIMKAYVNTVDLGGTRGRGIHGFAAASHEFFGVDDLRRLPVVEAATLVALLNQPSRYLEDVRRGDSSRLFKQRNRVLRLMREVFPDRYSEEQLRRWLEQPVALPQPSDPPDALPALSRHFLDFAAGQMPHVPDGRIYVTLDANLQRAATAVVEEGLRTLEPRLPASARPQLQAALIATNPKTGEVLAMVGGRSYGDSQFNRTVRAERQIGSIMKPFDYLAAFERARSEQRADVSPDTVVIDEPTVFTFPRRPPWKPANYDDDYAGAVPWRRALAESRNVAAVKVAAWAGFDRVASLWQAASGQRLSRVFPSISLGAIQATPAEVATAYAVFATGGLARPLRAIAEWTDGSKAVSEKRGSARRVVRPGTANIVTEMMRAVLDQGTGRRARAAGLTVDAAGKTGTTNDLRDAWFAGFSGDLLAVVWVGCDNGAPIGLTGAQAALPIWTEFMKQALQSR